MGLAACKQAATPTPTAGRTWLLDVAPSETPQPTPFHPETPEPTPFNFRNVCKPAVDPSGEFDIDFGTLTPDGACAPPYDTGIVLVPGTRCGYVTSEQPSYWDGGMGFLVYAPCWTRR